MRTLFSCRAICARSHFARSPHPTRFKRSSFLFPCALRVRGCGGDAFIACGRLRGIAGKRTRRSIQCQCPPNALQRRGRSPDASLRRARTFDDRVRRMRQQRAAQQPQHPRPQRGHLDEAAELGLETKMAASLRATLWRDVAEWRQVSDRAQRALSCAVRRRESELSLRRRESELSCAVSCAAL